MGNFIGRYGEFSIPEEKFGAFLADAKKVACEGGLFSKTFVQIFGKRVWLLGFPSFDASEEVRAAFSYSYYEDDWWEEAGINYEKRRPYSGKIGWMQYNLAVQALHILAETYSDTSVITFNCTYDIPSTTMKWLRYVLRRNVQNRWRWDLTKALENYAYEAIDYNAEISSDDFLRKISLKDASMASTEDVIVVFAGAESLVCREGTRDCVLEYAKIMKQYRDGIEDYRRRSEADKDGQIESLLRLLTCTDEERNSAGDKYSDSIRSGSTLLTPMAVVKNISEVYNRDFWQLWKTVKDNITVPPTKIFEGAEQELASKALSTEEFFGVSPEDRLYWWKKGGDVKLSLGTEEWLASKARRFETLCKYQLPGDMLEWQKRFVLFLNSHMDSLCFEDTFYEFFGSFGENKYRAALILLEETAKIKRDYRMLLAVFGNKELCKEFFGF